MKTNNTRRILSSLIWTVGIAGCFWDGYVKALDFGAGNIATALDLSTSSLTDTVLTVTSTSEAVTNTAVIGEGQDLTINGNVSLGQSAATGYSYLYLSGAGTFSVDKPGAVIRAGMVGTSSYAGYATLDMSELQTFLASLGSAGGMKIGNNPGSGGPTPTDSIVFATNTLFTAGYITIGGDRNERGTKYLYLGSGSNVLQVNTVTLGTAGSSSELRFNKADAGSLILRGFNGGETDRAKINVGVGLGGGLNYNHVIDLRGHSIDLLLSTLTLPTFGIGTSTAGSNNGTVSMDAGIIDVNDVFMGALTGGSGAKRTIAATMNLHGGTTTVHNAIIMATNFVSAADSVAHTVTATLSISNATVSVLNQASPETPALSLATMGPNASAAAIANGTLQVSQDGLLTVSGDIVGGGDSTAGGLATTTINLDGGTLLMPAHAILNVDNFTMTNATLAAGVYAGLPVLANRGTGTLAPGGLNAAGSTIISNSYVQDSTATLDIDLVSKLSYDRVTVTGAVTLAGSIYVRAPASLSGEFDIVTSDTAITDTSVLTGASTGFTKTLVNAGKTLRLFKAPPGTLISFL